MIETTDFSKSEQYTLSIRLSTDGFSFSVFNPLNGEGQHFHDVPVDPSRSLTANLKQIVQETEWLNLPYRRINILMAGKRFTFVPLEFFEDEQAEIIFYHNHPKQDNESVYYNILHKDNIVVLYGIDKSAATFLKEQFPNARFYAQGTPLIEYFFAKSRLGNSRKMYAHLRPSGIDLFAYERGRLLLANSYACTTESDRLYYLLYVWKQLGFEQERDELHLTGHLTDKATLLPELRKFIRQVFVMNPAVNLDFEAIITCE
ncbi:MAG: DUF3822 family protein [Bacteroides sp.]|nr:DUF3822 family protein [Bacteroides sp.]